MPRIKQGFAAFKSGLGKGYGAFNTYTSRKIDGFRSTLLILAGYACIAWGAFCVNTAVGWFVSGFLLLVLERSVESPSKAGDAR